MPTDIDKITDTVQALIETINTAHLRNGEIIGLLAFLLEAYTKDNPDQALTEVCLAERRIAARQVIRSAPPEMRAMAKPSSSLMN
jgi:hypothetical protein